MIQQSNKTHSDVFIPRQDTLSKKLFKVLWQESNAQQTYTVKIKFLYCAHIKRIDKEFNMLDDSFNITLLLRFELVL